MMEVQKYLLANGLEKLQQEFSIVVTDYPDRCVLNYNQIESPRFHPIVEECRALILRKGTWEVMARSFDRFFNASEGVKQSKDLSLEVQRVASFEEYKTYPFSLANALIQEKLDGSLLSLYWDGEKWCVSTRKMAFAEGQTNFGITFADVFKEAANKTNLYDFLSSNNPMKEFTFVFELTSPMSRVVTPYTESKITLIGGRWNKENYRELCSAELDNLSFLTKVDRPKVYNCSSYEELFKLVKEFPSMQEGVVLVIESQNGSHWRVKCKNPQFVAIAHMRENGNISPKRILTLVMANEHHEYLKYFAEDTKYFDFVEAEYAEVINRIKSIYRDHMAIKEQKEFALAIMPKAVYSFEKGVIFGMRKKGGTVEEHLNEIGAKKIALGMNMKKKFIDKFHVAVEEEEENEKL